MERDEKLWQIAKKRASFKQHFASYLIVNGFLWLVWLYTGSSHLWPIYPTLGWGMGLTFHYVEAYYGSNESLIEKEYQKLKEEEENKKS